MASPESEPKRTCLTQFEILTLVAAAALIGGGVAYLALKGFGPDPDRPPIIVRNGPVTGSIIVAEVDSDVRGELTKDPARRTWYHKHNHGGPDTLNAFVVGIANNTCGSGGTNYVSDFRKAIVDYSRGDASAQIEIQNRGNRVEIDVVSDPDPTNVDAWTLSFNATGARLTRVRFVMASGTVTCDLDAGGRFLITQHH